MDERLAKAAEHWSNAKPSLTRTNWWSHPAIVRHVNKLICGHALDGQSAGFQYLLHDHMPVGGFKRGVSIGSGVAAKEIALLTANVVQTFDLYEISEERLRASKRLARRNDVFERIRFHREDVFETKSFERFDLVYWNSSLHHMFDARQAVSWSYANLEPGGYFAMDDFVGASRFQWPDDELGIATKIRQILPERLLIDPDNPPHLVDRQLHRPDMEQLIQVDPSEAADSSNIMTAVRDTFPDAEIILAGGLVYSLALGGIMANFDDEKDEVLMQSLLLLDETLAASGYNHQAVVLARKEQPRQTRPLAQLWRSIREKATGLTRTDR